jgi:hypothetical protein
MNTSNRAFPPMSKTEAARMHEAYKPHTAITPPVRTRSPKREKHNTAAMTAPKHECAGYAP